MHQEEKKTRGRTRSKEAETAVLDAAYELLNECGLKNTTVEAIASRSGVSKMTIYKWWPNRSAVIMSAFLREAVKFAPSLEDMTVASTIERLSIMSSQLQGPLGTMMAALIAEGQSDTAFAADFRLRYIETRRVDAIRTVERGIADGIIKDRDPQVILDLLYAPVIYRLLIGHQPLSSAYVADYIDLVMNGMLVDGNKAIRQPSNSRDTTSKTLVLGKRQTKKP